MIAWKGSRARRHRRRTDLPDGPPRFAIKWHEPEPAPGAAVGYPVILGSMGDVQFRPLLVIRVQDANGWLWLI